MDMDEHEMQQKKEEVQPESKEEATFEQHRQKRRKCERLSDGLRIAPQFGTKSCSRRGSNPRPAAHKTTALTD